MRIRSILLSQVLWVEYLLHHMGITVLVYFPDPCLETGGHLESKTDSWPWPETCPNLSRLTLTWLYFHKKHRVMGEFNNFKEV